MQIARLVAGLFTVSGGGGGGSPFYPPVSPFSFTSEAGSLGFPEGNGQANAATYTAYKGALVQDRANLAVLPASTSTWCIFAVVRMPRDKRYINGTFGIFGNTASNGGNRFRMRLISDGNGTPTNRGRFEVYNFGGTGGAVNLFSPIWNESSALLMYKCNGASNHEVAWFSTETGAKNSSGISNIVTGTNAINSGSVNVNIGSVQGISTFTSNVHNGWAGCIEAVCMTTIAPTDTQMQNIALGADIVTELGAANIKFLRDLNGTTTALSPTAGTNDTTNASSVISGSAVASGSTIRRQSLSTWLMMTPLSDGWVYGLVPNQTTKQVPFSGTAGGLNGHSVEVRVVEVGTGRIVRDWTNVATVTAGTWAGNLELPKAEGWWVAQARCNGVLCYRHDEFAVGYKIVVLGQSQTSIALSGSVAGVNNNFPMTGSYLTYDDNSTSLVGNVLQMGRIGMFADETGKRAFLNAIRAFDPTTPIMLIDESVNGTGQNQFIDDTESTRLWSNFQLILDTYGNDISVVVSNWGTNIAGNTNQTIKDIMTALMYGTGVEAKQHDLVSSLQAGFAFVVSPLSRHVSGTSGTGADINNTCRLAQVEWANDNNILVGLPISDMRIEDGGGPHQNAAVINGSPLFIQRLAIDAAKALGLTNHQNPYFTTASLQAGNTQIVVNVALPNGGTLFSPAPTAITSFAVNEGGGFTEAGFAAAIVGNAVVITKTIGTFAAGTQVRYISNMADRANGSGAAEDTIVNGALYETWAGDTLQNKGLPVLGSLSGGKWIPTWQVTV